jgi:hypothetical protein
MIGRKSEHYAAEQWVDFVNRQLASAQSREMQEHLDEGCEACAKASTLWRQVGAVAKREALYEAPEWALRYVQNAFEAKALPQKAKTKLRIPRLVLDSFWQPAAVGVRSVSTAPRHLLYRSFEIAIEMQLEPEMNSERVNMTGQVSNVAQGGEGLGGIPIRLTHAGRRVVEGATNDLGEFQFSFVPEKDLQFSLDLDNGEQIAFPVCEIRDAG